MKLVLYVCVLLSTVSYVQPLLFLSLAKTLFDQVFGVLMFLGINTGIDTIWGSIFPTEDPMDKLREEVMGRFDGLTSHIQQAATITVQELNNYVEESQYLVPKIMLIEELMKKLDSEEKYIKLLRDNKEKFENETVLNFANGIISAKLDSVTSQMTAIYNMVVDHQSVSGQNFMELFIKSLERTQYHKACHLKTSPQQHFINFFKLIMKTEMRTLELGQYAYALKSIVHSKNNNHSAEAYLLHDNFNNRTSNYAEVLQNNLHRLSDQFFLCDPEHHSASTFQRLDEKQPLVSMLPEISNIQDGKVVVGLKLVVHEGVLRFQLLQAPLTMAFHTNASEREWVPLHSIQYPKIFAVVTEPFNWKFMMKKLTVPENTVLTGISFVHDSRNQLDIQVRYTPVLNATTAEMDVHGSAWIMEVHDQVKSKELSKNAKESTSCQVPSFPDVVSGQIITMKNLGDKNKYHMIPYIDTQEIVPSPIMALSGVGITHKGHDNCGGYLTPVAITLSDHYIRTLGKENENDF